MHVEPESPRMEQLTKGEIIKLTRDAYAMAAEVFNFFHNTVKKTVSFTADPVLTNENPGQNGKKTTPVPTTKSKAKVKAGKSTSELGDNSTKSPTTSTKTEKKERRKMKVEAGKPAKEDFESSKSDKLDATSDPSEKKTKQVNEPLTARQDITSQMGAMSICCPEGTPKTAKKKKGKK